MSCVLGNSLCNDKTLLRDLENPGDKDNLFWVKFWSIRSKRCANGVELQFRERTLVIGKGHLSQPPNWWALLHLPPYSLQMQAGGRRAAWAARHGVDASWAGHVVKHGLSLGLISAGKGHLCSWWLWCNWKDPSAPLTHWSKMMENQGDRILLFFRRLPFTLTYCFRIACNQGYVLEWDLSLEIGYFAVSRLTTRWRFYAPTNTTNKFSIFFLTYKLSLKKKTKQKPPPLFLL